MQEKPWSRHGFIDHYFGPDFRLSKLRNVLGLAAAAIMGTAVSGIGGAIAYRLFHSTTTSMFTTWQHWFASDGLGIITVAPLLIELASASRDRPSLSEVIEGALAVAALALVSGLAIFLRSELLATVGPVAVLFAPLLWLAARCRPVSPQQPRSSSAFQSFGRPPLASAILVTRVLRRPIASWRLRSAFYL